MKKIITITIIIVCFAAQAAGQTFTDQLKKPTFRDAKVTVTQSKEIDKLVNGTINTPAPAKKTEKASATETKPTTKAETKTDLANDMAENKAEPKPEQKAEPKPEAKAETKTEKSKENTSEEEAETASTSTSHKKMMKGGKKITGYRVQAFAGGNKRADREAAERAGKKIKSMYPEEAIYVHFYSPRWICRVGNYRTQTEARQMLSKIKKLGFTQACIIKVKISVAY